MTTLNVMPGHLIRRLHQISTQVFQQQLQTAGLDLTPVQFATMAALHQQPGQEQAQIAAKIAYDRATIGGVIDRLEQRGYVIRQTSARDRRAREVSLSEAGDALYQQAAPLVEALQNDILERLSNDERIQFMALLSKAVGPHD